MRSVALLLCVLCSGTFAWADFFVPGAVCVEGPVIAVRDLLRPEGEHAARILSRIGDTPIMTSPKFQGARATLVGSKLRGLLAQELGVELGVVAVPDRVHVQRGGQVVASKSLYGAIDKVLTQALAQYDAEISLREYRMAEYFFLESSNPCSIRVVPQGRVAPGRVSLRFEAVDVAGQVLQSFTGTVFADVWKTVPCAARVLNRGDILEPALVTFARKNLAFLPRPPWDGRDVSVRMAAAVGEGQVIVRDAVEPIPVVRKGQMVTLVYEGRTITLSVPVESLEDGGVGSVIRVRNVQSRNIVAARVLNAETVKTP